MNVVKQAAHSFVAIVPTLLIVLGAVAISCGVAMIYLPAGIVCAGVLAVVGGVLMVRGGDGP